MPADIDAAGSSPSPSSSAPRPSGRDLDSLEKARSSRSLRVAIVTENFLPKVDGVTRTLAMLLEHLQAEGHEALVLGPSTPLTSYAGAEVVSTKGIPLLGVYRGLGLNFLRPRFIRKLREFDADLVMFIDPIWLCAQAIAAVQYCFPHTPLLSSYHTNLAMYATLFGFPWLTPVMWSLQRALHGRCQLTFCPSPSTARMLGEQGFENVRLWPRGVDTDLFRPDARDFALRQSWGVEPLDLDPDRPSPRLVAAEPRSSPSTDDLPAFALPPPYTPHPLPPPPCAGSSPSKLAILYVGRISWEKNLRLLIDAARGLEKPDLASGRPACQLVFVGDGPARAEVESLCASYGLGALFLGFKKGEELAAAYASADVFAFPSFTETFGQVGSEAQASGLPVVGLRAEGVSDLVEHGKTGLLLDLNDLCPSTATSAPPPYALAAARTSSIPADPHALLSTTSPSYPHAVSLYRTLLVSITTDHARRRTMGSAAHLVASKRSWWRAMEDLCDGFRELAALKAGRLEAQADLERTSTIEVDVVYDEGEAGRLEKVISPTPSSASSTRKRRLDVDQMPRRSKFMSTRILGPLTTWTAPSQPASPSGSRLAVKATGHLSVAVVLEAIALFALLALAVACSSHLDLLSSFSPI
ncbi:hypothetical protein JCM8208_002492 [Rhodotorula glutinis]